MFHERHIRWELAIQSLYNGDTFGLDWSFYAQRGETPHLLELRQAGLFNHTTTQMRLGSIGAFTRSGPGLSRRSLLSRRSVVDTQADGGGRMVHLLGFANRGYSIVLQRKCVVLAIGAFTRSAARRRTSLSFAKRGYSIVLQRKCVVLAIGS